jgi:PAS domain S-box-containing protein
VVLDAVRTARVKGVQLEEAITQFFRDAERNFAAVVEASPYALVSFDSNGKILLWNPAAERVFGYSRKEAVGSSIFDLIVREDRVDSAASIMRDTSALRVRPPDWKTVEMEAKNKDGRTFPVDVSVSLWETNIGATIIAIMRDISERKQVEDTLLRSARLAAVGEMVAMVAHDLRNPLTVISTAAYFPKGRLAPSLDRESASMLDAIEKAVDYSNRTMNDLLEYTTEMRLRVSETDPRSVTQRALAYIVIPGNVRVSNLSGTHPKMVVDVAKMTRVFVNLLSNAIDAMPQGGNLSLTSEEKDGEVQIILSDTGTGIPEDALEQIWTPVYTTKAKGMGLGLPIVRRFVEAHKSTVTVRSKVGEGTTFTVRLPLEHG